MGKIYFYVGFALVMTMLLNVLAIDTSDNSGILQVVGLTGFTEDNKQLDFSPSTFFRNIFGSTGILILAITSGIIIGLITRIQPENYIILPFIVGTLVLFVGALWNLIIVSNVYDNFIRIPLIMFAGPFTIGYIVSLIDWFRGRDLS